MSCTGFESFTITFGAECLFLLISPVASNLETIFWTVEVSTHKFAAIFQASTPVPCVNFHDMPTSCKVHKSHYRAKFVSMGFLCMCTRMLVYELMTHFLQD